MCPPKGLILWAFSLLWTLTVANYCSISSKHTACVTQGFGSRCGSQAEHGVSRAEIQEIMDAHNRLRAKVANGLETGGRPGPQPPAADMSQLEWDDELAHVAQKHADNCYFEHDCSECRRVSRFGVGQNLYIYKQTVRHAETNWTKAIKDWYLEVLIFDRKWVNPFKFNKDVGHYTAMLWANTNRVGCGMTAFKQGKWFSKLYTCNYGPAGNFIDGEMYAKGSACTKCPPGTFCSTQHPGLCASASSKFSVFDNGQGFGNLTSVSPSLTSALNTRPETAIPNFKMTSATTKTTTPPSTSRPTPTRSSPTRTATSSMPMRMSLDLDSAVSADDELNNAEDNSVGYDGKPLFKCNFESSSENSCPVHFSGKNWTLSSDKDDWSNHFYQINLNSGETSELFFGQMVPKPISSTACLTFKYRKFLSSLLGGTVPLQVIAWPHGGRAANVNVRRDSPDPMTWIRAEITFRKINNEMLLLFRTESSALGQSQLSLDDVRVMEGACPKNN